jgi:hypothetical protein
MHAPKENTDSPAPDPESASDTVEVIYPCTLDESQIRDVRDELNVGDEVEIMIPKGGQGVKDAPDGWVSLYLYPFTIGLSFPFPKLICDFIENLGVAFTQIMPYVWRVLLTAHAMSVTQNVDITLGDLLLAYKYRSLGDGTFTLRGEERKKGFVHMASDKDQGWRGTFLYLKTDSLGHDLSFMQKTWRDVKGNLLYFRASSNAPRSYSMSHLCLLAEYNYPPPSTTGREAIESFYALPLADRSFPGVIARLLGPKKPADPAAAEMSTGTGTFICINCLCSLVLQESLPTPFL